MKKYKWRNSIEQPHPKKILAVLSAHGFGHAARTSAVLNALVRTYNKPLDLHLLTETPRWFFESSLSTTFHYHKAKTDVGLVQQNPLLEDLDATAKALGEFYPLTETQLDSTSQLLADHLPFDIVLCDIAPMGITLAQRWEIPSVLIENFTWPWIYRSYPHPPEQLLHTADYLSELYDRVTLHIRCEPTCDLSINAHSNIQTVAPIARNPRFSRKQIREQLEVPSGATLVTASMGGIPDQYDCIQELQKLPYSFILAGSFSQQKKEQNCWLLPHRSTFYHPDLINASDIVIGKLGYSTVAEIVQAQAGFGYLTRPHFPESESLQHYVESHLASHHLSPVDFYNGQWQPAIEDLLEQQLEQDFLTPTANGAQQCAQYILEVIN